MNEQEMRELFREMRDEPVPADSLARVRAGVDQRIQKKPGVVEDRGGAGNGWLYRRGVFVAEAGEVGADRAREPARDRAGVAAGYPGAAGDSRGRARVRSALGPDRLWKACRC